MGVNSDILTWWQGTSPPRAQSAVLSVPWEYLRFFSMIGFIPCTGTLFSPFASPLWSIFDRFFACSTHILDDIMDNDTWVCKSSKNATPFQRETNQPNILGPPQYKVSKGPCFQLYWLFYYATCSSYQSLSTSIFSLENSFRHQLAQLDIRRL